MALKVGDRFASYEDFETAFQSYKNQKCVEFTVVDSRNIERINATTALSPLPNCLKFSRIRFCCIHHSKNKIKKNQTKQVPPKRKRSTFALGCSAEVTVTVCRKSERLVIRKLIDEHNHPCDRASFDRYPAQRRLDHEKPQAVENKQKLKVSVKNLSQYIKTTSGRFHVTMNQPSRRMFTARFIKGVKQFTKEDSAEYCHLNHRTAVSATKPANASVGGTSVAKRQCIPQSKCQKYKQAMAVFSAMADLMSSLRIQEFSAKLQLVTHLLNYWNKGTQPILYCADDPQTDCGIAGNQALPCQMEIKSRVRHGTAVLPVVQQNDAHGTLPPVIEQIVVVSPLSAEADGTSVLTIEVPDATSLLLAEAADAASQLVPVAEDATSKPQPAAKECKAYFCAHPKDSEASNAMSPNEPEQTKPVATGTSVTAEPGKTSSAAVTETKSGSIPDVLLGKRIPSPTPACQSGSTLKKLKKEPIMKPHQRFLARPEKACETKPPEEAGTGLLTLAEDSLQAIEQGLLLADEHIHAASILLRSRFPQCQGLADPVLGSKLMFGVAKGKFVQIIHDVSRQHWLTVSNIQVEDADVADVEVFDSLFSTLTMETKVQIAAILHSQKPEIKVRVVRNQAQQGSRDCGLFAIAVATSLLFGEKPEDVQYKQNEMRPHLLMCLRSGIINPFPRTVNQTKRIRTKICVISIYCLCRLPDNQEQRMIQCSSCQEWYHQTCLHLTAKEVEVLSRSSEHFFCGGGGVKCLKG